jgi:hypothetical protein
MTMMKMIPTMTSLMKREEHPRTKVILMFNATIAANMGI